MARAKTGVGRIPSFHGAGLGLTSAHGVVTIRPALKFSHEFADSSAGQHTLGQVRGQLDDVLPRIKREQ
jgi:hypothetical protein